MKIRFLSEVLVVFFAVSTLHAQVSSSARRRVSLDKGWRFALGNAQDSKKDFGFDDGQLFFMAKAGNGNGPASAHFDDRSWRTVNVPHDWTVELPFDSRGDQNHGAKAIGRNFPENSIGWYRKEFRVAATDEGKRVRIDFDGVYRNSQVWVNGFYMGTEHSGYAGFGYDVTNYLNYDGPNFLVVRVDASTDEGWFYEGAGIYRHIWMTVTDPVHVARYGTYVTTDVTLPKGDMPAGAVLKVKVTVDNDSARDKEFRVENVVLDQDGKQVAEGEVVPGSATAGGSGEVGLTLFGLGAFKLWSVESPVLYKLETAILVDGAVVDRYETPFGIRKVEWTADNGFLLNGKRVEIKGTNDHQDHAGVGIALPDDLQVYRIEKLKALGSNAIRTSHHPPTPELLDAADRLGMLILDESRQMGTTPEDLDQLTRQIKRDRNHPSVVIWSLGNEEWALEWSVYGTRLARDLTAFAKRLDPSRRSTVAMSGSGGGISLGVDVMGFNYYVQHNIDEMHKRFPERPVVGTEESSSEHTRGQYFDDPDHQRLVGFDFEADAKHASIEDAWKFYRARPWAAGLFYWTGFDYRGETSPFGWPATSSQFGLLDTCGFMKDTGYLAQSFWSAKPMVHLATTWTLPNAAQHGEVGKQVSVLVYSNAAAVELFLNGISLGRKMKPIDSHLEWQVVYAPGVLTAKGYDAAGNVVATDAVETVGAAAAVKLEAEKAQIAGDGKSVAAVTVRVEDAKGRVVPDAGNLVHFTLTGPGKIIGVGNGDPASHEADVVVPSYGLVKTGGWKTKAVTDLKPDAAVEPQFDDGAWETARDRRWDEKPNPPAAAIYRTSFTVPAGAESDKLTLLTHSLGDDEAIYLNGHPLAEHRSGLPMRAEFALDKALLTHGKNVVVVYAKRFTTDQDKEKDWRWDTGGPVTVARARPAGEWKRSVFHGLAQVIVQSTGGPGEIRLTAESAGITGATAVVTAK
jgi:beta-galactosidase